jgi:hypothetical protein
VSLLTIYCDESGTDAANRVAVVGGYIGQTNEWRLFEQDWTPILRKRPYRVKLMHRADLESWHGEFTEERGWNLDRRKALLQELHPIIKSRTITALGTAVIKQDFEEVMPDWLKQFFGGVYGWCAHECVVSARMWCMRPNRDYRRPINWVFECGAEGFGRVQAMFDELRQNPELGPAYRIGSLAFSGKDVVPLQAADTLAYEIFKQAENQIVDGGKRNVRFSIKDLLRSQDIPYLKYWDRARLREWLAISQQRGALDSIKQAWAKTH